MNKNQLPNMVNLLTILILLIEICNGVKYLSIDKAFTKGASAYSGERWSECIAQFEEAIHLYKLYKSVCTNCRLKCNSNLENPIVKDNIEDLKMYETFVKRNDCVTKCKESGFNELEIDDNISEYTLNSMQNRTPYQYIHICYFQMYNLPKAASAAYTYLAKHPTDPEMIHNLEYYAKQPEVDKNEITDLEGNDYVTLHRIGLKAYGLNNWEETIAAMEEVLIDYILSENSCRAECDHLSDHEPSSEFVIVVTRYIKSILQCKQSCQKYVQSMNYDSGNELLADVLNYLQISYYHTGRYVNAAKALQSYLLISPDDEDMLKNKKFYSDLVNEEDFIERSEITQYYKRNEYETKLLNFLRENDESETDNNIYM